VVEPFRGRHDPEASERPRSCRARCVGPEGGQLGRGKGAFIQWGTTIGVQQSPGHHRGHFVDLATLTYALTGRHHRLESACAAFGIERPTTAANGSPTAAPTYGTLDDRLLDYARADVAATAALYLACVAELAAHPDIELRPDRLRSPAGLAAAYLDAMGVTPPLVQHPDIDREGLLGAACAATYPGRVEARIVGVRVPVVALDWSAAYPAVCALAGLWRHWKAQRFTTTDVTDELVSFLEALGWSIAASTPTPGGDGASPSSRSTRTPPRSSTGAATRPSAGRWRPGL
jgi:hypothetical protein